MKRPNPQACAEAYERIKNCMHIDGHDGGPETVVGMTIAQREAIVLALKFCAREPFDLATVLGRAQQLRRQWADLANDLCPDYFEIKRSGRGVTDRGYMLAAEIRACAAQLGEALGLPAIEITLSVDETEGE